MRDLLALVTIGVMLLCVYGFMATFEPPGFLRMRIVYGGVFVVCLGYVVWVVMHKLFRP